MGERLKAKVAIVTGAGSVGPGWGNGKATAVLFAREGAKVVAVDINPAAAEETRDIIVREGGECIVQAGDVSKAGDVQTIVERCMESYGHIDILHNNVGIVEVGGPVETSEESWDRVNAINLKSVFLTCKYVLPYMERQGSGAIINIASVAGIRWLGVPYISYSATKAGVIQLTQAIAAQYASKNIRCNCILPGFINTPMIHKSLAHVYAQGDIQKMMEIRSRQCPMGRMGDAWDVAYAALFLASDEAKYITGIQLIVDGGLSCTSVSP
ncbi:MAG TPA: SDR family NAD(P)-dependent oxidoreductase [Candidatus Limnocylindrales bacterium]|nr:SDR family NAD(P)-dependent oxidoreductase [Candidatus Limnocylindrales bacterium]